MKPACLPPGGTDPATIAARGGDPGGWITAQKTGTERQPGQEA